MYAEVKRILLVEDNVSDVELTLDTLARNNLANEVIVARDGVEAMDYLCKKGAYKMRKNGNPVVILLDIKMPKKDGLEVLKEIRNDSSLRFIPVVMLTSSKEEGDLLKSYSLGVNAYVVKPVAINEFMDAIKYLGIFWALINEAPPGSK